MPKLRLAITCVKLTFRPNVVGAALQEDRPAESASTTDEGLPHENCLSCSAQHVARTTTSRLVGSQTL
eukprot:10662349-Prorocentrum_lima.AAC.1